MSASRPISPSARKKVAFASHTIPQESNLSVTAKCEEIFSSGLATLHSDIRTNDTVNEIKKEFIQALDKSSEKLQMLNRFKAPDFVPHSIRFNPKLKTDLVTAEREDYKELSDQFDTLIVETKQNLKEIMLKAKEMELETRNKKLRTIASKFAKEIIEEFFIIHEYAEN